jgi:hypothetical protein
MEDGKFELPHREDYTERSFYHVVDEELDLDIWQCNDCGAVGDTVEQIEHHDSCKPGESEYWKEFYTRANEEEDSEDEKPANCTEPFTGFIGE